MSEPSITFICDKNKSHFAEPIIESLSKVTSIKVCESKHLFPFYFPSMKSDIIWVEWARKQAVFISKIKRKHQKLFIRLHRFEINDKDTLNQIEWNNVDTIIFVNSELEKQFSKMHPQVPTVTIPNALDISNFPYSNRTSQNTLLTYGLHFIHRKAYHKLIILFLKLLNIDSSFTLTIAGRNPEKDSHKEYLDLCYSLIKKYHLEKYININFLGSHNVLSKYPNTNSLLLNHNAIISYSDNESFHYAFAEGLLSGLQGFCRGWGELDLKEFWSNCIYHNEEEMLQAILEWGKSTVEERNKIGVSNRQYVIDNFSAKVIAEKYLKLFESISI